MATVLTIPTYDGSGQAVHPDVVKVGSTYWMAITPYPNFDADYENPSILSSADGTTWAVPGGVTNPIVAKPAGGYNADCDLVWDGSAFNLFYLEYITASQRSRIYLRTSADGITWSGASTLLEATGYQFLSPAVVFDGTTWRMWTVKSATNPNVLQLRTASTVTGPWSSPVDCTVPVPDGYDIWHLDVAARGDGYVAALNYCTEDESGSNAYLALGASGDGLTWIVGDTTIEPAGTVERVYRGSLLFEDDVWKLWYGDAQESFGAWRTLYDELDPSIFPVALMPPAFGVEVGFNDPTFTVEADRGIFPARFGIEVGFQSEVRFNSRGRRQVMLTGSGIETPEMTTGGNTGQVLSFDEAGAPTWVDAAGGTPATTVESETTFGIAAAVGTDTHYARQDHTHGTPANPVTVAAISALGFVGPILISDTPSTPLVFADLIQNEAQDDLVYADL